jgi:hypothetical protein
MIRNLVSRARTLKYTRVHATLALLSVSACFDHARLATPCAAGSAVSVPRASTWKYFAGPAAPVGTWQAHTYNDSGWNSGPGPLGYGEGYIETEVPFGGNSSDAWNTTYFRHTFYVGNLSGVDALTLGLNYDDGAVVYVNGTEVARRSMPVGTVNWGTPALAHEASNTYEEIDFSAAIPLLFENDSNTIAVEVHQTSPSSSDLVMDLELREGPITLVLLRGPYIQNGAPNAMTVRWRTNIPTPSRVRYGAVKNQLYQVKDVLTPTTEHEVRITGLPADSERYYSIGTLDSTLAGNDDSTAFHTNPPPGDTSPIRVWVIGDAGTGSGGQQRVRNSYAEYTGNRRTDLWLMLGDNAYDSGTDSDFQNNVFEVYPGLLRKSCVWPTRGNHDFLHDGPANDYYEFFTMPKAAEGGGIASGSEAYYSFDYGNIHFICLDSEGTSTSLNGAMVSWLRQDLEANKAMWTIAFWHHPPYSDGSHNSDDDSDSGGRMGAIRRNILPILDSTGVDLVLSGHSHSYERSFLLKGHYGVSSTLASHMVLDSGPGQIGVDGPYLKPSAGSAPFEGAVYIVDGASGNLTEADLDHPVMVRSLNRLGSVVLDIHDTRLDAHFVDDQGAVRDSFTILKGAGTLAADPGNVQPSLSLALRSPNPGRGATQLEFTLPTAGEAQLAILDAAGRRIARILSGSLAAGPHRARWDGRGARGMPVPSGVYFAVLEQSGEHRAVKLVVER